MMTRRNAGRSAPPGLDVQLTQYGDGHWRATFYVTGALDCWRVGVRADAVADGVGGR